MKTTLENPTTFAKTNHLQLISGDFGPSEAEEIVNELLSKKINFNSLKNFSSQVRFGQDDAHALQRIEELNQALETFKEILQEAKGQGKNLRIRSTITIDLI